MNTNKQHHNNWKSWKASVIFTKTVFVFLLAVFSISCSIAPLTTPKTGRSLGEGNWEVDAGASPGYLSVNRGFSENFDAGLTAEMQIGVNMELSGKYAFINNSENGTSLALFGGIYKGSVVGGSNTGFRLGPVLSYKSGWWEPYLVLTYNLGKWRWEGLEDDSKSDKDNSLIDIDNAYKPGEEIATYSYMQFTLGMNFWVTKGFALNINTKYLTRAGGDISIEGSIPLALGLYWRF